MADKPFVYIPPGRLVSGDLTSKRTINARGMPIPEDKQQFEIGVAVRKDSPDLPAFMGQAINGAKTCYAHNPQVAPLIDAWAQNGFNGFSMKVVDGDVPSKSKGVVNPNTAGCLVIYLSSSYPIDCSSDQNIQIDPQLIKRGYYVDVQGNMAPNNNAIGDGIGVFMNPGLVRLLGVGEEIQSGMSVEQKAAQMPAAPALPPGALPPGSAPVAPAYGQPPAQAQAPAPAYGQPPAQAQAPAYGQPPAPAPAYGQPPAPAPAPAQAYGQPPAPAPAPAYGQPPAGNVPGVGTTPSGTPSPSEAPPYPGIMTPPGV